MSQRKATKNTSLLFPKLRDYLGDVSCQQDDATPHFADPVRQYMNRKLESRWIGRAGLVVWPPRSSALTVMGYLFADISKTVYFLTVLIQFLKEGQDPRLLPHLCLKLHFQKL